VFDCGTEKRIYVARAPAIDDDVEGNGKSEAAL
jgi:hypothetical protein